MPYLAEVQLSHDAVLGDENARHHRTFDRDALSSRMLVKGLAASIGGAVRQAVRPLSSACRALVASQDRCCQQLDTLAHHYEVISTQLGEMRAEHTALLDKLREAPTSRGPSFVRTASQLAPEARSAARARATRTPLTLTRPSNVEETASEQGYGPGQMPMPTTADEHLLEYVDGAWPVEYHPGEVEAAAGPHRFDASEEPEPTNRFAEWEALEMAVKRAVRAMEVHTSRQLAARRARPRSAV